MKLDVSANMTEKLERLACALLFPLHLCLCFVSPLLLNNLCTQCFIMYLESYLFKCENARMLNICMDVSEVNIERDVINVSLFLTSWL